MHSLNISSGEEEYLMGPRARTGSEEKKQRLSTKSMAFLTVLLLVVGALAVAAHEQWGKTGELSTSEYAQVLDEPMVTVMGSDTLNKAYNFFRGEGANPAIARSLGRFTTDKDKKIEYGGTVYLQPDQVDVTMNAQCWGVQQELEAFGTYSVRQAISFAAEATFQLTSVQVGQALALFSGWGLGPIAGPRSGPGPISSAMAGPGPNPGPPGTTPNPNPSNPNTTPKPKPNPNPNPGSTPNPQRTSRSPGGPGGPGTTRSGPGPVIPPGAPGTTTRPGTGPGAPGGGPRPGTTGVPGAGPPGPVPPIVSSIAAGQALSIFFGGSFGMAMSKSYAGMGLTTASNSFMQSSLFETFVDWERPNSKFEYQPEFKRLVSRINNCARRRRRRYRSRFWRRRCRRLVLRMFDRFGSHVIQDATYGARCTMTTFMEGKAGKQSVSLFLEAAAAAGLSSSVWLSASGRGPTGGASAAGSKSAQAAAGFKATGEFSGTFGAGYKYQIGNIRCEGVVEDNLCDSRMSGKEENPVMINYAPFPIWKVRGAGWKRSGRRIVQMVVREILSSFMRCNRKNCGGKGVCVSNPMFWNRVSSGRFRGRLNGLWRNRCMKY